MMSKVFSVTLGAMIIFASNSYVSARKATTAKPHCGIACDHRCSCHQCMQNSCVWMNQKHHFPSNLRRST
jgi:hypothetical protein